MKFKTATGAILETSNDSIAEQFKKYGYEVVTETANAEKPKKKAEQKAED